MKELTAAQGSVTEVIHNHLHCILSAKAAPAHFDAKEKQIPHLMGVCVLYLMEIPHLDLLPQGESLIDIHRCCTMNQHKIHTKVTPPLSSGFQPMTERQRHCRRSVLQDMGILRQPALNCELLKSLT